MRRVGAASNEVIGPGASPGRRPPDANGSLMPQEPANENPTDGFGARMPRRDVLRAAVVGEVTR